MTTDQGRKIKGQGHSDVTNKQQERHNYTVNHKNVTFFDYNFG